MAKKFLSILLVLVLVLGLLPAAGAAALSTSPTFSDMPDNWATEALESAVANGLLVGNDGKIMPDSPLTRAQMATIIARAFGATEEGDISEYTDVKSTDWFGGSVAKALKMGVMHGYDGRMNPKDNITREQAFAVLARAFKLAPATAINKTFEDLGDVSDWAKGEVYALVNAGYIHGSNGRINPQANISRAEFAQMIHNLIKQYIKAEGEYTEVADGNIMVNVPDATLKNVTINGDLIVGDGVGDGDLILDNVTLKGRLVARGGGANSIIIRGGSVEGKVIIAKVDGDIRVSVEGGADVKVIIIDDGKDDVIIEGTVGTVEVTAAGVPVVIQNATVEKIEVVASGATNITVANGAAVTNVVVNSGAVGTTLNIEGNVNTVETSAANTAVSGTGTVKNVTAKEGADNTTVTTPSTKINNEGASGVTAGGGKEVPEDGSTTNNSQGTDVITTPPSGGYPGGGGGGGSSVAVSAININKSTTTLVEGTTETLTVTFTPSNASNKTITWTTSDASKATIDSTGKVRAVSAGTATITAKSNNGKTATCVVTVTTTVVPVSAIKVNKETTTLVVGATETITATVEPSNASNKKVTWSSSDETIATVVNGKITAVAVGTATITVTSVADSSKKATVEIIVLAETSEEYFVFEEATGTITDYKAEGPKDVAIPAKIGGVDVKVIGDNAFSSKELTSIVIPNSVITIGEGAFAENELTSVEIPNAVTIIGEWAFVENKLTSLVIPNSVITIGEGAFAENELTSILIPNSVTTIGPSAFFENKLTSLIIPNSVKTIGEAAFNNNQLPDSQAFIYARKSDGAEDKTNVISYGGKNRENVIIPETVVTIGEAAFEHNYISSVIIPDSVIKIEDRAFKYNKLTEVSIPDSVKTIGDDAFANNGPSQNSGSIPTTDFVGTWEIKDGSKVWTKKGVVSVSAITVTSQGDATTVVNGKTLQMGVDITPTTATNQKVTWSVTDGTGSATISSSGLLTATKVGTVTVKALAQDGSGEFGTKEITIHADLTAYNAALAAVTEADYTADSWVIYQGIVTANKMTVENTQEEVTTAKNNIIAAQANLVIPVTGISISGNGSVAKDDTLQLTAIITPDNATNPDVTWSIETGGTGSATIDADGLLKPTSEGTVTVKVVSQYDVSITATKKITVTASKLDAAKANAKSELDKYVKASDYTINAEALNNAIENGKTAINSATNETEVAAALADAKAVIDTIKSDAQIAAEELATAKESAKTELENYKVAANYTRNAAALSTAIENGKTAIDNATDIEGVNTALANAKTIINAIKSDKDLDDDDIATAKTNIQGASYTATQAEVSDASAALSKAQALVNALGTELKGTTATVLAGTFTGAVAGDFSTPAGTNGSYTFTVTIAKGSGTQEITEQTMTITATPYDSTEQDNTDIATAKANIEAASYTATQAEASDSAKALTKAQALVNALGTELKGTSVNVIAGTFTGAITGTEAYVSGTDGSYTFTVKISKDKGTTLTTDVQTMTITATKYDPTADNTDIATAKAKIESAAYTATQAEVSDASAAKTKVETIISGLDTAETIVDVVPGSFSGAIAGVDGVFAATDGSYTFTVKINKGGGTEVITKELTLTITATETTPVSKASTVKVDGEKELDSINPYLVGGEPAASGTLGSAGCTAHFDSSNGVLTLQGYNGAGIRTWSGSNPDLIIKLIDNNTVTTTNSQNGIYNGNNGNIYITSDSDATLNVDSALDNNYVYAIATNGRSIIIGGKAKVTVTAKTTAASQNASVAHANKDFIIQDNASFTGTSTAIASGSYAVFTKEKIIINTTGNIDIDCSASSGSYAFNGMNGVDIKNVTLMTLKKATTGSFIAGSKNLSRVAVNIKDNIATYRGGIPYELKVSNGQITAVQEGQIGVPYQGLENDEITITANTIANFEFVKWTNGDGTDIDSSLFVSPTGVDSPEAKIKMPAKDLNIKAEYKSTLFTVQPSFHRSEKKIKWNVGEATFSGSGDSFKLQKKTSGEWKGRSYPSINTETAKNGDIDVNNNPSNYTLYLPDGNYRLYFKVDGKDHYSKEFVVEWEDTITISAIEGVTAPVTGETPVTTITGTEQYTGTVTWSPTATNFAGGTAYTATITLTAKGGFTLDGVAANFFTVEGAAATNLANSGVVTAVFPKTGAALSGDATLTSTMGTVDNSAETIVDIPYDTSLENFKAAITPATGASFEVYKADGTTKATDLASGYKVIVTAEDTTTTKIYTITVKSEHFANGSGTESDPYKVSSAEELNNVRHYLGNTNKDVYFKQTQDINLNVTPWNTGEGWVPIGVNTDSRFNGKYDGDNKIISGIRINRPNEDYQGLFGTVGYKGTLININLTDVNIKGKDNVGGLVGFFNNGTMENCSATGIIEGAEKTGGLVGTHSFGTITKSYSTCTVTGTRTVGGLAGYSSQGSIEKSYSTGNVTGNSDDIGGLIGFNGNPVTNCYATGDVEGPSPIGGLIGRSIGGSITNSYAIGKVTKTGGTTSGGLVDSFSAGETSATVGSSYYDSETTGQLDSGKGEGKTTAEMQTQATFDGTDKLELERWDFTNIWKIETDSYPTLQ